jgi:hypothetical protein
LSPNKQQSRCVPDTSRLNWNQHGENFAFIGATISPKQLYAAGGIFKVGDAVAASIAGFAS